MVLHQPPPALFLIQNKAASHQPNTDLQYVDAFIIMGCLFLFDIAVFFSHQIPLQKYRQRLGNYRKVIYCLCEFLHCFLVASAKGFSLFHSGRIALCEENLFSESDLYNADVLKISFAPVGKSSVCVHLILAWPLAAMVSKVVCRRNA